MRKWQGKEKITPKTPLVVAKAFRLNGRDRLPGEPFDARRGAVPWRRIALLYEQGKLGVAPTAVPEEEDVAEAPVAPGPAVETAPTPPPESVVAPGHDGPGAEQGTAGDAGEGAPGEPADAEAPAEGVVHRGGGWYDVVRGGRTLNEKPLRKTEADALAAQPAGDNLLS